jgi:hypothetical protein
VSWLRFEPRSSRIHVSSVTATPACWAPDRWNAHARLQQLITQSDIVFAVRQVAVDRVAGPEHSMMPLALNP